MVAGPRATHREDLDEIGAGPCRSEDLGRRERAGDNRHASRFRCLDDVRDDTGRDDKFGAGAYGTARALGVDHRSRADEDTLSTSAPRQLADDVNRIRDRECDLGDRQPGFDEYFSDADGDIGAVVAYAGYHA